MSTLSDWSEGWQSLPNLSLQSHPKARNQTVASRSFPAGSSIISIACLTVALLPSQKGWRCDECHLLQSADLQLRRCSGCAAYWYCGLNCQTIQWKRHHKQICRSFNDFTNSSEYQALSPHEQLDAIMLSHLVAELAALNTRWLSNDNQPTGHSMFMSLLPGPTKSSVPPLCPMERRYEVPSDIVDGLFARFGNNNFAVHSHLRTYAHGIFPLASRLFNHSCVPNSVAKYILSPSQPIRMEVVALRKIDVGEEICIPYLDPALVQSRQQIFQLTYGFNCTCPSCMFIGHIDDLPLPPKDQGELEQLERQLRRFVFSSDTWFRNMAILHPKYSNIPGALYQVLHESYLAGLSENFSRSSHDGLYETALQVGFTLLALYALIYPPNYPQIGMHLLEMAKTAWNAFVSGAETDVKMLHQATSYLALSSETLNILGPEGDSGGPLDEIRALNSLLKDV